MCWTSRHLTVFLLYCSVLQLVIYCKEWVQLGPLAQACGLTHILMFGFLLINVAQVGSPLPPYMID